MKRKIIVISILIGIVLMDQIVKIAVKTSLPEGESIPYMWGLFLLSHTENPGSAFGTLANLGKWKILLIGFRILLFGGLLYLISDRIKKKAALWTIVSWSLIAAGALGNIIDNIFYDVWFIGDTLTWSNPAGSYFNGKVVDMCYFPLWGFNHYIFNIADAAITIGLVMLLLRKQKK